MASAAATVAALAVLQAVDGVALKRAVDEWIGAAPQDKASAFQVAEGVRWVEYWVSSLSSLLFGVTTVIGGAIMVMRERFPSGLGWLGVLCGLAFGAQGVVIAYDGSRMRR